LIQDDKNVKVGTPYLTGAKVIGEIVTQGRDEKIVVYRYKRRKGFQRKRGHHQLFTAVKIAKIVG
jgi:large subunit ribosomal protein L21